MKINYTFLSVILDFQRNLLILLDVVRKKVYLEKSFLENKMFVQNKNPRIRGPEVANVFGQ